MSDQTTASENSNAPSAPAAQERDIELRMQKALQSAWKYVNIPLVSNSAKDEVGEFANADVSAIAGKRIPMLFALQTAWSFVHGAKDTALMAELSDILGHGERGLKNLGPKF